MDNLKIARNLYIKECVWQLGSDSLHISDSESMKKYHDDLKTLKILCESVKKDRKLDWNVAAVGDLARSEKVTFDVEGFDLGR